MTRLHLPVQAIPGFWNDAVFVVAVVASCASAASHDNVSGLEMAASGHHDHTLGTDSWGIVIRRPWVRSRSLARI